ncbi:MAG: hypothetical protein V7707_20560 [Motiliproteus sp.]
MNLDKSKKRIAKRVKMGFQGYPEIAIAYSGQNKDAADQVTVTFTAEESADPMSERFQSASDVRQDEAIQSAIVKMIERSGAKTVKSCEDVELSS